MYCGSKGKDSRSEKKKENIRDVEMYRNPGGKIKRRSKATNYWDNPHTVPTLQGGPGERDGQEQEEKVKTRRGGKKR